MEFNGFHSISEYERECARLGFKTERVPFRKGEEDFFALITRQSVGGIASWHLITADERAEVMDGVINGIDANYLGRLREKGFELVESGK